MTIEYLAEYICDKKCKFPCEIADQDELEKICEECIFAAFEGSERIEETK